MNSFSFKRFQHLVIVALFSAAPLLQAVAATGPQLTGPQVVVLPYVEVPFLSSETLIRQGKRDAATGACVFSLDMKLYANHLPPGQKLGRIQRAYDPDTCRELVEEGTTG